MKQDLCASKTGTKERFFFLGGIIYIARKPCLALVILLCNSKCQVGYGPPRAGSKNVLCVLKTK